MAKPQDRLQYDRRRANFRLIEKELYCYHATKREFEAMRRDIIESSGASDVPSRSGPGDPTLNKVIRLHSRALLETERRLAAIEKAIEIVKAAPEPQRWEQVRLKYFDRTLTDEGIMARLHLSPRTYWRWRREFIELIADMLGWEV